MFQRGGNLIFSNLIFVGAIGAGLGLGYSKFWREEYTAEEGAFYPTREEVENKYEKYYSERYQKKYEETEEEILKFINEEKELFDKLINEVTEYLAKSAAYLEHKTMKKKILEDPRYIKEKQAYEKSVIGLNKEYSEAINREMAEFSILNKFNSNTKSLFQDLLNRIVVLEKDLETTKNRNGSYTNISEIASLLFNIENSIKNMRDFTALWRRLEVILPGNVIIEEEKINKLSTILKNQLLANSDLLKEEFRLLVQKAPGLTADDTKKIGAVVNYLENGKTKEALDSFTPLPVASNPHFSDWVRLTENYIFVNELIQTIKQETIYKY